VRYKASKVLLRESEEVKDIEKKFSAHFKKLDFSKYQLSAQFF